MALGGDAAPERFHDIDNILMRRLDLRRMRGTACRSQAVCSTQFVNIGQLCGAPADAGITMVIALSSSNWRGRQSSTRRLASPSCAVVMCGSIWELS